MGWCDEFCGERGGQEVSNEGQYGDGEEGREM